MRHVTAHRRDRIVSIVVHAGAVAAGIAIAGFGFGLSVLPACIAGSFAGAAVIAFVPPPLGAARYTSRRDLALAALRIVACLAAFALLLYWL